MHRPDKQSFYKKAFSDIAKINYKNVLDVCCGDLQCIKDINKFERYVGVDAVKELIDIARITYPHAETHLSKIEDFNTDEKFDLIVCFEAYGFNKDPLKEGLTYTPEYVDKLFEKIKSFHKDTSYLAINLGPQLLEEHESFVKDFISTNYDILNFYQYGRWQKKYPYHIAKLISYLIDLFPRITKTSKNKHLTL